ncbi:MAG: hypothetical protein K2X03_16665 [Bryobacteraceae bacterium]|nr:hypothetical protein [Bryobacteraceae bacterium]
MRYLLILALSLTAFAGGLYLEVTPGTGSTLATARVTACHEPAKSTVSASVVTVVDGQLRRQPLQVAAVPGQDGVFAISGSLPDGNVTIELTVTNPEYGSYQPRVLIRAEGRKMQMATMKHYFGVPPKLKDYRHLAE